MKRAARTATVCVTTFLFILPALLTFAQGEDTRYFEETGHNVSGEFLRFYDQHGGRAIFGYPLTREFVENGLVVQYFQRVRMEKHPENPEPYQVQLGLLGEELGWRQAPIPESEIPPSTHSDKRYFPETGHTVAFAFLEYYQDNGGLDIFGYPITEWIIELDGRIVQYFQRGKMEWYPENPPGQRVQLGMLGTRYVEEFVDPIYKERESSYIHSQAIPPTATPIPGSTDPLSDVTGLRIMATLKYPIIGLKSTQTVYVYVLDQSSHGVSGVLVDMQVEYKDGRRDSFSLPLTDTNGYTQIEFPIGDPAPGYVVIVNLAASHGNVRGETSTAFLPWW
jgi:hypothetical protein